MGIDEAIQHLEETLSDESRAWKCEQCRKEHEQLLEWLRELKALRDVVRCKDCVHYEMGVCLKIYSDGNVSNDAWQSRKPDDFCSYGEKIGEIAEVNHGTHGNQARGMLPDV